MKAKKNSPRAGVSQKRPTKTALASGRKTVEAGVSPAGKKVATPKNIGMTYAFEAARRRGYTGTWFWFPWLDWKNQITQWTREQMIRNINWMYNNVPPARAVIDGLPREEVDTGIWPVPRTSNTKFNQAIKEAFFNDSMDPRFFNEAAIENYHSEQLAIRRNIYLYGELFGQLLRPSQGSSIPTIHNIPAWQIGNDQYAQARDPAIGAEGSNWVDGTYANQFGRVTQYRAWTDSERTKSVSILADDILHFHDPFWVTQRRGVSCLTSAASKLFSMDDIERAANVGELLRQRIAYQITKSQLDDDDPTLLPGATVVDSIELENADGTKSKMHVQRIHSADGADIDVADLPPGRKIEMVESAKGGDAIRWNEHVLRDVALATPYPPEYVFFLGGISQGTVYRGLQKRVQRTKNIIRHLQLKPQFCSRWYAFWLWQSIAKGRFAGVEGGVPKDWYKVRWNFPADDSVDVGREGALMDERLDSGKMTLSAYRAALGGDPDDDDDEVIETRIRRLKKIQDAREILRLDPDYAELADDPALSYEMIFRQSTLAKTIREVVSVSGVEGEEVPVNDGGDGSPPSRSAAPGPSRNGNAGA